MITFQLAHILNGDDNEYKKKDFWLSDKSFID